MGKKRTFSKRKATRKRSTKKPAETGLGISRKDQLKFQTEDDLRTLRRAEEIKADKSRVLRAKQMANKEADALKKIAKK